MILLSAALLSRFTHTASLVLSGRQHDVNCRGTCVSDREGSEMTPRNVASREIARVRHTFTTRRVYRHHVTLFEESRPLAGSLGGRNNATGAGGGFPASILASGATEFLLTASSPSRRRPAQVASRPIRQRKASAFVMHSAEPIREYYLLWTVIPFAHGADVHQGARREASILKRSST